jgi:murein DD-endopeptidase MepM/ murein hydrolase activator NlpD
MYLTFLSAIILFVACTAQRVSYQPCPSNTISPPSRYCYIVKKGDSLWAIAKKQGVSVNEILKANSFSSTPQLKIGQSLIIPQYLENRNKLAFAWPLKGEIVNFFGETTGYIANKGLNIKASSAQTVTAAEDGKIIYSNQIKGWGKTIIIQHGGNFYTVYANLDEIFNPERESVKKGQPIGKLLPNNSGSSILHFEIRHGYIADNPMRYLKNS